MNIAKKFEEVFFFFLVILLPVQLDKHFWLNFSYISGLRIDYLAPTLYLTDIIIFFLLTFYALNFLILKRKKNETTKNTPKLINFKRFKKKHILFVFLIVTFAFINILFSLRSSIAIYYWLRLMELILLFFYLKNISEERKNLFKKLLPIPVFYSSCIAIAQIIRKASIGGVLYWLGERNFSLSTPGIAKFSFMGELFIRPYATFPHPNSLAGFILISLIFLRSDINKNFLKSPANSILLLSGILVLLISISQIIWIIAAIILLKLFKNTKLKDFFTSKYNLAIVASTLILLIIFPFEKNSIIHRLKLFKASYEITRLSPLVGVGLGNFIPALYEVGQQSFSNTSPFLFYQPVHNIYALVIAETGLLGSTLFFYFLIKTSKKVFQTNKQNLKYAFFAILTLGLVDHYWLTIMQNRLLFTMVLAHLWRKP